jgi:hypothetical protein
MNKIVGYGASLLLLAATGGLFFGASTAEAGSTPPTACPPPVVTPPVIITCNLCLQIVQDCFDEATKANGNISPGTLGNCLKDDLPAGCLMLATTTP